jgi:hypothetical protein
MRESADAELGTDRQMLTFDWAVARALVVVSREL